MISSEEIKKKSAEWSLNDDVKLLGKLKSLDELLSTKSKEILENVAKTDNRISNETVLVKNLINDFYLVGHKQFTENRVEEENESKHQKSVEHEESFGKSLDRDTQIHEQMKSVLDNSLKFVREKLKDLDQPDESPGGPPSRLPSQSGEQLNQDAQVERLIRLNRYHRKKLPPIVDSEQFMSEVFAAVKASATAKKPHSKPIDHEAKANNASESSSVISDLENISINERILEINENNFVERLSAASTAQRSSTSFEDVKIQTDSGKQKSTTSRLTTADAQASSKPLDFASNSLDQSQAHERREDKIGDSVLANESSIRQELDAIFGKPGSTAAGRTAKNRLFEDDSDDELFQPAAASRSQAASKAKDLFGSDSDESEFDFGQVKSGPSKQKAANLFDSNVRSSEETSAISKPIEKRPAVQPTTTSKPVERPTVQPTVDEPAVPSKPISKKSNVLNKLFDSDSEDDELFSSVRRPASDLRSEDKPSGHQATASTSKASSVKPSQEPSEQRQATEPIKKATDPIKKDPVTSIEKEKPKEHPKEQPKEQPREQPREQQKDSERPSSQPDRSDSVREASSSSRESLLDESVKMPNKRDLFKNQLEDLFSKKRNPSTGFVKVTREKEDSLSEDTEKAADQLTITTGKSSKSSSVSSLNKPEPITPRKEFDLFGTKPSENLTADDLNSLNDMISTLDNNLVKTRIRATPNRKRPTRANSNRSNHQRADAKPKSDERQETTKKASEVVKREDSMSKRDDLLSKKDDMLSKTPDTADLPATRDVPSKSVPAKSEPTKGAQTEHATSKDATTKASKKPELFSDSDDDTDAFFSQASRKPEARQALKESLDQKFAKLFDDSDDDQLFAPSASKRPAASADKKSSSQSMDKPSTDKPSTDKPSTDKPSSTDKKSSPAPKAKESADAKKRVSSLFDDDSDDDELFFRKN